jgi:hypothetical protein
MNKEQAIKIIEAYVSGDVSENELYIKEAIECVKGLQETNATTILTVEFKEDTTDNQLEFYKSELKQMAPNASIIVHRGEIKNIIVLCE